MANNNNGNVNPNVITPGQQHTHPMGNVNQMPNSQPISFGSVNSAGAVQAGHGQNGNGQSILSTTGNVTNSTMNSNDMFNRGPIPTTTAGGQSGMYPNSSHVTNGAWNATVNGNAQSNRVIPTTMWKTITPNTWQMNFIKNVKSIARFEPT